MRVAAEPKIIRRNCALLRRAGRCKFAGVLPAFRRKNRDRMCNRITAHARRYDYHLVRAAPRHPANASRHAKNSASREAFLVGGVCVTWWRKTPSDAQTKLCRTSDDGRNGGKTLHVTAVKSSGVHRCRIRQAENRGGPSGVPILCLTMRGEKHW